MHEAMGALLANRRSYWSSGHPHQQFQVLRCWPLESDCWRTGFQQQFQVDCGNWWYNPWICELVWLWLQSWKQKSHTIHLTLQETDPLETNCLLPGHPSQDWPRRCLRGKPKCLQGKGKPSRVERAVSVQVEQIWGDYQVLPHQLITCIFTVIIIFIMFFCGDFCTSGHEEPEIVISNLQELKEYERMNSQIHAS